MSHHNNPMLPINIYVIVSGFIFQTPPRKFGALHATRRVEKTSDWSHLLDRSLSSGDYIRSGQVNVAQPNITQMISDKVNKVYYSFTLILLWSTYGIFLPCCLFFLSIFFSSPNLSRRILDVCHTATDGVTLVRILRCKSETCCTRLAKKYRTQKPAKIRHLGTIAQLCRAIIFATKARIYSRKKLAKQQYLLHTSSQYGERRLTNGCDRFTSLGHPCKFQRVSRPGSVTARHSYWASANFCGVEQRAPPILGRATITLGIGPHSSYYYHCYYYCYCYY